MTQFEDSLNKFLWIPIYEWASKPTVQSMITIEEEKEDSNIITLPKPRLRKVSPLPFDEVKEFSFNKIPTLKVIKTFDNTLLSNGSNSPWTAKNSHNSKYRKSKFYKNETPTPNNEEDCSWLNIPINPNLNKWKSVYGDLFPSTKLVPSLGVPQKIKWASHAHHSEANDSSDLESNNPE